MSPPDILQTVLAALQFIALKLAFVFVSVGSVFSVVSLVCALCIAALLTVRARRRRGRAIKARTVLRALFPRGLFARPSTRADLGFFLFNVMVAGTLTGWAILSSQSVGHWAAAGLSGVLGPAPLVHTPGWLAGTATTVALFLAFEAGYYLDHWLSHHVPALWALHKPHHAAQTLTPITNFRVHPLESLKFLNIVAVTTGTMAGLCAWAFRDGHEAVVSGRNVIFLGLWLAFGHLQHSNLWITFPGVFGRVLVSPAHHQLHHSSDPNHFGRNLGSFLTVFDWMFGTLRQPARERETLVFGVDGDPARHHSVTGGLIDPIVEAVATLKPKAYRPAASRTASA